MRIQLVACRLAVSLHRTAHGPIFGVLLVVWVATNSFLLYAPGPFDPYPYILLNLFLSMLAALQAPVNMMSQNRQAAKDRMDAGHDYEVNLNWRFSGCTKSSTRCASNSGPSCSPSNTSRSSF